MVTCTSPYTCLYKLILLLLLGPRQENNLKFLVWPFFNITDIFCAKTRLGHACMRPNMIPSHPILKLSPPQIKLAFPRPSNCKFREKNCSREFKTFEAKQFIFYFLLICFVTLILRLSQTASDPTRLIRPRPIDCDCGIETPVKIFLGFFLEKRIFF